MSTLYINNLNMYNILQIQIRGTINQQNIESFLHQNYNAAFLILFLQVVLILKTSY
jgi:hypothetical protein